MGRSFQERFSRKEGKRILSFKEFLLPYRIIKINIVIIISKFIPSH